jgi:hypothetical protein
VWHKIRWQCQILKLRKVIAGNFVNVYSKNDWILNYLYRGATFGGNPIGFDGLNHREIIDIDLTHMIKGHLDYREKLSEILLEIRKKVNKM